MKKSGADKKRVRRSSGAIQNGSRDSNSDTPPRTMLNIRMVPRAKRYKSFKAIISLDITHSDECFTAVQALEECLRGSQCLLYQLWKKQAAKKDVYQLFAEKVRDHKNLVSRWAVLQETRVEYFRGKDFVKFLKNHPEVKEILESESGLEVDDIGNALLRKNLLVRCDRVVKTVRPGKKKLSTWPAHLEIYPDQLFSENDAFFAWTFVKRRPLWQTLLSFFWPVLTLAICLFPVYPHRCKLIVLYSCAGVLLLILCLLSLRAAIFGAIWIVVGKRVWFFPNILAEEATLGELFRFWPNKDEEERPKWTARLFYSVVAVLAILLLRHHAPDEAARARYQKRVSNIIDDVLEWSPRLALSGMMENLQTEVNETVGAMNNFTDGSKSSSEETVEGVTIEEVVEEDGEQHHEQI